MEAQKFSKSAVQILEENSIYNEQSVEGEWRYIYQPQGELSKVIVCKDSVKELAAQAMIVELLAIGIVLQPLPDPVPEIKPERKHLTIEEATAFFAELYFGEHHIPGKIKQWGYGFCVEDFAGMSTFDFSGLTRFVVMCHDKCIRGEIRPSSPRSIKVIIHKRQGREGGMCDRHPTIETAIETFRSK